MAYEDDVFNNIIIFDAIMFTIIAIICLSILVSFALLIALLMKKLFIERQPRPRNTSSRCRQMRPKPHLIDSGYDTTDATLL